MLLKVAPSANWYLRIAIIYSLVGGLWIIFSDRGLALLVSDPAKITLYSTYKGWLYVFATAVMLYHLIRQSIYELHNSEIALSEMVFHDPVTNLPNRTLFLDKLSQEIKQANLAQQMFGVLFIDLDHFKRINDTLGHAIGDTLLQAVASRIAEQTPAEYLVARMGGDEFTL